MDSPCSFWPWAIFGLVKADCGSTAVEDLEWLLDIDARGRAIMGIKFILNKERQVRAQI